MPESRRNKRALQDRFVFPSDFQELEAEDRFRSRLVDVHDVNTNEERTLRLWTKTKTAADGDLRALWRHEVRHVQRVMSYADARDLIVEALEFVEDEDYFGIVLDRAGQSVAESLSSSPRNFWLRRLAEPNARVLFWKNVRRVAAALGILHAQGLVHANIGPDVIFTDGFETPDFRLSGFEWSLWVGGEGTGAPVNDRRVTYAFEDDWRSLGHLIALLLDVVLSAAGDVLDSERTDPRVPLLKLSERRLLRRLVAPSPTETVDAPTIVHAIDDLLTNVANGLSASDVPLLILTFVNWTRVGEAVYDATQGEIAVDDLPAVVAWLQADLDAGGTLLVPRNFEPASTLIRLVTTNMAYELGPLKTRMMPVQTWEVAVGRKAEARGTLFSVGADEERVLSLPVTVVRRFDEAQELRARRAEDVIDWSRLAKRDQVEPTVRAAGVKRALILIQTIEALVRTLESYPVEVVERTPAGRVIIRAQEGSERDAFAGRLSLGSTGDALRRLFDEDQRDAGIAWRLARSPNLGASTTRDISVQFVNAFPDGSYEFEIDRDAALGPGYFLRADGEAGTEQVIRRRLRSIAALDTQVDLARALEDPWRERRQSPERLEFDDAELTALDAPKRQALRQVFDTIPTFFVVGPPGVGKTRLATEIVQRRFSTEPSTRMLVSAQGHDALNHLQEQLRKAAAVLGTEPLVVRSRAPSSRRPTEDDVDVVARRVLGRLKASQLGRSAPPALQERVAAQLASVSGDAPTGSLDESAANHALESLLRDGAQLFLSTANSLDVERMVEAREQFDWVIIEEAAKATGPELIGPLLLAGRRLLIGDHHQLAPMEAERIRKILSDDSMVLEALQIAKRHLAPVFAEVPILDDLIEQAGDPRSLRALAARSLKLLEPFRAFVEDDEAQAKRFAGRRISSTLTEQRRMDPAIARVVSEAFYDGRLVTESGRLLAAETDPLPYELLDPMPPSPIVVVDFPHVSTTGAAAAQESHRPRWHNAREVDSVIDVLCRIRAPDNRPAPSLAILSPYAAQVARLKGRLRQRASELAHLDDFARVQSSGDLIGTVDSFQGSEADMVILSLVRNNARVGLGALGFLRDRRRMNVALSRAKRQLVIVGSLKFLDLAARGVNPKLDERHELQFISKIVSTLRSMTSERSKSGIPLVTIVDPADLRGRR